MIRSLTLALTLLANLASASPVINDNNQATDRLIEKCLRHPRECQIGAQFRVIRPELEGLEIILSPPWGWVWVGDIPTFYYTTRVEFHPIRPRPGHLIN